jgi:hypothetical protein
MQREIESYDDYVMHWSLFQLLIEER